MKLAPIILLGAALSFASACHATPEPAPVEETAIEPDAAPMVMPMVGGPCRYDTSRVIATVTKVGEATVEFSEPDARPFNLPPTVFAEPLVPGQEIYVVKRMIVKGTCTPVMYAYDGPVEPDVAPAPAN